MAAFTAIAAGVGLAATAATTVKSFSDARKQKKLQQEAQAEAERAMAEAKKRLEINVYEKLGIAKLPYEQAREAALVQGAMATESARESERGVAATAGRVQMAQQEQQSAIAAKQEQELMDLEKLVATEEGRLLDIGTQLNLEEVAGAQQAAADAEQRRSKAMAEGFQGVTSLVTQAAAAAPLFGKSAAVKQEGALRGQYEAAVAEQKASGYKRMNPQFLDAQGNPLPFQQALAKMKGPAGWDYSGIGAMKDADYANWVLTQKGSTFKNLAQTNDFLMPKQFFYPTIE
jgi:hypothetical protein